MSRIFLALDTKCMSPEKLEKRIFGGAELFFLLLAKYLREEGYEVEHWPNLPSGEYDLCIHSNVFEHDIKAKKHIIWAGSWHASGAEHADRAIVLTNYMKSKMSEEWKDAFVIPAPYHSEVENYKTDDFCQNKIVCTSNPNRHYLNTMSLAHYLKRSGTKFSIEICGGNKLYSEAFPESHNFHMPKVGINYLGPLPRIKVFELLASAQIWAYAAFEDWAETQSVSPIEAMAMGIPTVLPRREPFVEVAMDIHPQPMFCDTLEEFCDMVDGLLRDGTNHVDYDVSRYSERIIFPTLLQLIGDTI